MPRIRPIPLLLVAALGVATTIGVAWTRAWTIDWWTSRAGHSYFTPRNGTNSSVTIEQRCAVGAVIRNVIASDSDDYTFLAEWSKFPLPVTMGPLEVLTREHVDDTWGAARRALIHGESRFVVTEAAFGWPLPAVRWWTDRMSGQTGGAALRHNRSDEPWTEDYLILPTIPIWRGFLLNSFLFACAWWLLFLIPLTTRRVLRRRRGGCPACGYDLSGQPACPECGWNQQPQAPHSTPGSA